MFIGCGFLGLASVINDRTEASPHSCFPKWHWLQFSVVPYNYKTHSILFFLICYLSNLIFDFQLCLPIPCVHALLSEPELLGAGDPHPFRLVQRQTMPASLIVIHLIMLPSLEEISVILWLMSSDGELMVGTFFFSSQNHVNPAMDFTQTPPGMLALDNMLYFAKHHQDAYIRVSITGFSQILPVSCGILFSSLRTGGYCY